MTYVETNEQYPTTRQMSYMEKKVCGELQEALTDALLALEEAKGHFAWLGAKDKHEDCIMIITEVQDLKGDA